jgi:hypothetical protein
MTLSFYPLLPAWLILTLLALSAGAGIYAYRHRNPAVAPWQHTLLLALRLASLALVTVMLLCPGHMIEDRNLEKSHIVFLADNSFSMSTRDLPARQSRWEKAVSFLQENRFKRLADYPLAYYTFNSQTLRQTNVNELSAMKTEGGTDFKQAIARIDKDIGLNRTAAIALLTDGIDTSGFKGSEISVPIISVRVGTDLASVKDLGIEPFKCPSKINEGEELTLEIPLLMQGYPKEMSAAFRVLADRLPVHSATLTLSSGRAHAETVKITLAKTGIHTIRIECATLPDEVTDLNNQRELVVEVVQAKEELAAYFPVLNNSFRPLLREFSKGEDTVFTAVYRVSGDSFRLRGQKMNERFNSGLPKKAEQLKNVTCLILGSHNGELLTPAESLVLERYVDRGGTLICLAGSDSFGKLPAGSPLIRLLPVVTLEDSFKDVPFRIAPETSAGDAFAAQVGQIIADNGTSPDMILKGLNHVKDVKGNAKVLLWAEGASRSPLLVWQNYGHGKVIALLSNALHLWGPPEKRDENFGRFWRQLVAFAKNPDEESDLLKVALPKTELATGERVTVTAVAHHPEGRDEGLSVKADVFPVESDTPVESLSLDKKAGSFMGELAGLKPGRYVLRVSSQDGRDVLRTRYKLLLVGDVLAENARIRVDREAFRTYSSEKHILTPDEAGRLEDLLREAVKKNVVQREKFLIFETPLFFIALVLLLMTEWFLRRRFNLF